MRELITLEQANHLMLAVLVAAPIVGLVAGASYRRPVRGLIAGLLIGAGNLVLWKVYNLITDRLGLDTVKNLLVNLALFVGIGLVAGFLWGRANRQPARRAENGGGALVGAVAGGGPPSRDPGDKRVVDDARKPPRDAG